MITIIMIAVMILLVLHVYRVLQKLPEVLKGQKCMVIFFNPLRFSLA